MSKSREKLLRIKSAQKDPQKNEEPESPNKAEITKALKRDKEMLDKKLENSPLKIKNENSKKSEEESSMSPKKNGRFEKSNGIRFQSECMNEESLRDNEKIIQSADDIFNRAKNEVIEINKEQEDERLCYVCLQNQPDAILMSCGHGGICCECATTLIRRRNACMECRRPLKAIYKINTYPKGVDVVKGFELSQIVELNLVN